MQGMPTSPGSRPPRTRESRTAPVLKLYRSINQHVPNHSPLSQRNLLMRYLSRFGCGVGPPLSLRGPAGGRSESPRPTMDCRSAPSESPLVATEYVQALRDTELAKMVVRKVPY